MSKAKRSYKKSNRSSDMDQALFDALTTAAPPKDTGPDPDNILSGLFDDEDEDIEVTCDDMEERRHLVLEVDEADRASGEKIIELVLEQTGEQIELSQAIKIALKVCPFDSEIIGKANDDIRARSCKTDRN